MPRVSVLVPAYNAQAHLGRALASVFAQRYDDWEVIVADDGSSDATADVARSFGDRVIVARAGRNGGLAAARNLALTHASGDLVALLDSDDAWLPEYLSEQVALHERTGAAIVCCDAFLERDGTRLEQTYGDRFGRPGPTVDATTLVRTNPIFVGALCPREIVAGAGGFDAALRSVEDLDLWLRIVERGGRVAYNPRPLAVYTLAAGTLSTDTLRMARSRQRVLRNALGRGRLDDAGRRAARRALRLQQAVEQVELLRAERHQRLRARAAARAAVVAPFVGRVAVERAISRRLGFGRQRRPG